MLKKYLKNFLFMGLLTVGIFVSSACNSNIIKIKENETIDTKNYGVLIFSVDFRKNGIQELPLYFTIEGLTGGSQEFRVDMEENLIFVYLLKEGTYILKGIKGENDSPAISRQASRTNKRDISTNKMFVFDVRAGQMHYVGNLLFKDFSDKADLNTVFNISHESYRISADIQIQKKMSDIVEAMSKHPYLKKYNLPLKIVLMEETQSEIDKQSVYINEKKLKNKSRGYGEFSWGLSIQEVKEMLEIKNKKVMVIGLEELIDNTLEKNPIEFHFAKQQGNYILNKVVVHLASDSFEKTYVSLIEKYRDFASKTENSYTWITPETKVILEKKSNELLLTYESMGAVSEDKTKEESLIK